MPHHNYVIRTMTREEINLAVDWAAAEGWNPGIHDADCFFAQDPEGFLVGLLDGEPIGSISAVSYPGNYGFLGFYIVKPKYRGKGFGIQLWNAGLERLPGMTIGLDGVVAQQANYERSGFRLAYRNIRQEWKKEKGVGPKSAHGLVNLNQIPFEKLFAYDRRMFGIDRKLFLRLWINRPRTLALGALQGVELTGYGVIRACRKGFKIGPLFAEDAQLAETLFLALTEDLEPRTPVFLDTPEVNAAAVELAERYQMETVFETARMYLKGDPDIPVDHWFGVTSFELG